MNEKPWAVFRGKIPIHLGLYETEQDVWQIYLGWPSLEEIDDAKHSGLRAARIIVQEVKP